MKRASSRSSARARSPSASSEPLWRLQAQHLAYRRARREEWLTHPTVADLTCREIWRRDPTVEDVFGTRKALRAYLDAVAQGRAQIDTTTG